MPSNKKFHEPDAKQIELHSLSMSAFCQTGDVAFHKNLVWTGGPSTCIVIMARTKSSMFCWHFASVDALDDDKLEFVKRQLAGLQLKGASFFLVPGVDRDSKTWDLKPECRSMVYRPGNDPTASRKFFVNFMQQFEWFSNIEILPQPNHCREFIVFRREFTQPVYVRDDTFFNTTCTVDAELMT